MSRAGYCYIVRYRINKALKGLCLNGGCNEPAKGLCEKCRVRQARYNSKCYLKRKGKLNDK